MVLNLRDRVLGIYRKLFYILFLVLISLSYCGVEPIDWICPDIPEGSLVLTEIRGSQDGPDTYGQWIELFNRNDTSIRLAGIVLNLQYLDGTGEKRVIVRDHTIEVSPGDYLVLGVGEPHERKQHIDYAFGNDFTGNLYNASIMEIYSCNILLDRVVYRDLPTLGSLSLDGRMKPDANANDDESLWCPDESPGMTDVRDQGLPMLGNPGTPGERNPSCVNN